MDQKIQRILKKYLPTLYAKLSKQISSPLKNRLAYGAFWGAVGTIFPKIITLVVSFLLARTLGQKVFGEYGIINSTVGMVSAFSGLGLGATIVKFLAEYKFSDPEKAGRVLALTTLVNWVSALLYAILFVAFAPWVASKMLAAPHLAPMLKISAITLALGTINSLQQNFLTGIESFKTSALILILTNIFQSIALIIAANIWKLTGVTSVLALSSVLTTIIYINVLNKERKRYNIRLLWKEAKVEWEILVKFSLPAFLSGILVGPAFWGSNAILANQNNGYVELGTLNAASQWQQVVQFLPAILGTALLPIMVEKIGKNQGAESFRLMVKMMKVYSIVVIPIVFFLSLFGEFILKGYGNSFISGYMTFVISLITSGLIAIMSPVGNLITASGKMWIGFFMNLGWAILMISGSLILVSWGSKGIAGARLFAYIFHSVWVFGYVLIQKNRYANQYKL